MRLEPEGAALLAEVCASTLFSDEELPSPSGEERQPPRSTPSIEDQLELLASDAD